MNTAVLFITLFACMAIGMPVAISLGLSSLLTIFLFSQDSLASMSIKLFETSEHYTLMAIPFFVLAGNLMSTGGVAKRMVRFAIAAVGHLRGGLAIASVLACMLFAAVSGSSPATVVAIGSIVITGMLKNGYTKEFAAGVICNAGTLGILIPPSIVMVVYAAVTEVSVGRMFMAGVVPGILLGLMLMAAVWWRAGKLQLTPPPKASMREVFSALVDSFWGLALLVIIMGGIYGGIFTPTEAAAVSAVYALFIAVFTASYLVGYLVLFSPGGLGFREAALTLFLVGVGAAGQGDAVILGVTSRVWLTVLEVVPGLVSLLSLPASQRAALPRAE